jgi:hypothetical protein
VYSNKSSEVGKYNMNAISTKWVVLKDARSGKLFTKYHAGTWETLGIATVRREASEPVDAIDALSPPQLQLQASASAGYDLSAKDVYSRHHSASPIAPPTLPRTIIFQDGLIFM